MQSVSDLYLELRAPPPEKLGFYRRRKVPPHLYPNVSPRYTNSSCKPSHTTPTDAQRSLNSLDQTPLEQRLFNVREARNCQRDAGGFPRSTEFIVGPVKFSKSWVKTIFERGITWTSAIRGVEDGLLTSVPNEACLPRDKRAEVEAQPELRTVLHSYFIWRCRPILCM